MSVPSASFYYRDASGRVELRKDRYDARKAGLEEGPAFVWSHRVEGGAWETGQGGHRPLLYRQPEVETRLHKFPIFWVEGENKVDRLWKDGLVATWTPHGSAAALRDEDTDILGGAVVVVLPDMDHPGLAHARRVVDHLRPKAACVVQLDLGGLLLGEDIIEWLDKYGHSPDELIDLAFPLIQEALGPSHPIVLALERLPTLDSTLAAMPPPGDRLETGIPTLDKHSRGGFARGRVYTFVGPPGKGKTALMAQLCRTFADKYDATVIGLFIDEGAWQAAMMMCEGLGFDRAVLEDSYADIQPEVAERTRPLNIRLARPDDPETTLETVDEWLVGTPAGALVIIAADSVQRVRPHKGSPPQTRKDHADAVMAGARRIADKHNAVVMLAAKANRASWSHKNPADNLNALSGALDSSSVEYDSDALFFMAGDPSDRSFLFIEKNRPGDGQRAKIALGYDRDRATFAEIDQEAATEEAEEAEQEQTAAAWSADEARVLKAVRTYPGRSGNMLRELLKMRLQRLLAVLQELERKSAIERRKKGWFVVVKCFPNDGDS